MFYICSVEYGHICKLQKLHNFMSERDRIELLMKCYELTPSQFADRTGIQRASVSHIISGRNKPSLEVMLKIYDAFPGLDIKWLMTGVGDEPVGNGAESAAAVGLFKNEAVAQSPAEPVVTQEPPIVAKVPVRSAVSQQDSLYSRPVVAKQPRKQQVRSQSDVQLAQRRIKEVRIFYTDGTYETLVPEK